MDKLNERQYWREKWRAAWFNVPPYKKTGMGRSTMVRRLLGYSTKSEKNAHYGAIHFYTAKTRGDKPRDPQKAWMLEMLAGPHGKTIAYALAIQQGLDIEEFDWEAT